MTPEGAVIKLVLQERDETASIEYFSLLQPDYFSEAYTPLYKAISQFYQKNSRIPSLQDLKITHQRSSRTSVALSAIELLNVDELDINVALQALMDQYAQNCALEQIESLLEEITMMDTDEIKAAVASIPMVLDEKIQSDEIVSNVAKISVFEVPEDIQSRVVLTGISNEWDSKIGGFYRQDLVLLGGIRGTGKSILSLNLADAQQRNGYIVPYFTIEMTGKETQQRFYAIRSGVKFEKIKYDTLEDADRLLLAKTKASLYTGGDSLYEQLASKTPDERTIGVFMQFETELERLTETDNKLIIIDHRELPLATIDVQLTKLKAKYGGLMQMAIVDYLNQVIIGPGADMYGWKEQIFLAKQFKNLARKHDICMVSPFQMDDDGKVRFAKGILDACDTALLIHRHDGVNKDKITLETAKARGSRDDLNVTLRIDWETLRIDPQEVALEEDTPTETEGPESGASVGYKGEEGII